MGQTSATTESRQSSALAYAGALPFVACALAAIAGIEAFPLLGSPLTVASAYGLVIASFMAGILWGVQLTRGNGLPLNLFVASNVVALAAWFGFLLLPGAAFLLLLAALFALLLAIDDQLHRAGTLASAYMSVRRNVTLLVITSLLAQSLLS